MAPTDARVVELARELSAPLAAVAGHAAALRVAAGADSPDMETVKRLVDEIARACARASEITRELVAEAAASSPR